MTSSDASVNRKPAHPKPVNSKPKMSVGMRANLVVTALVLCLGPVLIGVGSHQINTDAELVQAGERVTGTIVQFDDVSKASERDIKVEFQSTDGSAHFTWATVDHDQHPVVGEEVTVVYRALDPSQATVLGFESDGVFFRGLGIFLTAIFGGIGVFLALRYLLGRRKDRRKRTG
ncbi:DUF3592 domain-containing protein [Arthrobacter sp. 24S4-2]|uniref:DUF3592 domain-containing protein n=1 Tax=Arthrobacter sp. 24S4-2 TaxID=2575374 RepID=UPI0020C79647|nr:DUF3592 domain-containing protein [Arthrobacter sp. 24S4-2]